MQHDNPADRLLAIILEGKQHNHGAKCRAVWQKILGTEDEPTLLVRLGLAAALPRQVISALQEANPKRGATWGHWHPQISEAFALQLLNGDWQSFIARIDVHSVDALRSAAELLELRSSKSLVEPAKLDELKLKLTEILKEVRDATDIDSDLKKKICKAILGVINSIDQYLIEGIDGIAEAVDRAVGAVVRDPGGRQLVKKDGLGKKLRAVLTFLSQTVDSAEKVKELGADAAELLDWVH